jgi:hypothetical protein
MQVEDVISLAGHYNLYVRFGFRTVAVKARGFSQRWIENVEGNSYEDVLDAFRSAVSQAVDAIEARGR